ncbi:MAG TPA: hypothetical protein VF541_19500, partial [Longimicrobium sp.]
MLTKKPISPSISRRPRPAEMEHAGAAFLLELDAELTAGLRALSRRHETTLYMTLLAAWAAVLGR